MKRAFLISFLFVTGSVILFCATACNREESETANESAGSMETDSFGFPAVETRGVPAEASIPEPVPQGQPSGDSDSVPSNSYKVPRTFLDAAPGGSFRDPRRMTAKEVFEAYGVDFGPGTGASFDPASSKLFVRNTEDQLDLVEAVVESLIRGSEKQVSIRVEIYQLPALVALKLEQSVAAEPDHTPEWEGVIRMVGRGEARFVTSVSLIARSGQRARAKDVFERIYTDYRWTDPEKKDRMEPYFETRNIGTTFEVDPVLGPDDKTIDLNFGLEHHTAPPTYRTLSARFADSEQLYNLPTPEFHVKKITTQLTILDGQVNLIGAWRPTGKPEFEANDLMQVAFLKTNIQIKGYNFE